ncbi:MAG: zinc ribbon domain-containing protein [Bacteroidia bacterium]
MINKITTQTKKKYAVCQSCGSPFSKNSNNYFRITGGFYDVRYCTDCFENDHFTEPNLSMEQMKQKLIAKLKAAGMPGNLDRFTDRLHTLERWKNK